LASVWFSALPSINSLLKCRKSLLISIHKPTIDDKSLPSTHYLEQSRLSREQFWAERGLNSEVYGLVYFLGFNLNIYFSWCLIQALAQPAVQLFRTLVTFSVASSDSLADSDLQLFIETEQDWTRLTFIQYVEEQMGFGLLKINEWPELWFEFGNVEHRVPVRYSGTTR